MIVFDIRCEHDHVFEAWFDGADAFHDQRDRGLVTCPYCDSGRVERVPSALAIGGKAGGPDERQVATTAGGAQPGFDPAKVKAMLGELAKAQADALAKSDYVGGKFADEARSMHYGEQAARPIYGETRPAEAKALREEGVPAMPLLFPVKPKSDA